MKHKLLYLLIVLPLFGLSGQERFHSSDMEIYRALGILGKANGYTGNFQSYSNNRWSVKSSSPWHSILNRRYISNTDREWNISLSTINLTYSFNSTLPYGLYDQAQWQGRGNNVQLNGGLAFEWRGFTLTLEGSIWFAQNQDFELIPELIHQRTPDRRKRNPHEYWFYDGGTIDYPQRPTDANLLRMSLGQSGIRYSGRWWTAGLTNENVWIGPARFFPIVMSDQADGFPHIDVGTRGYVPLRIGNSDLGALEARLLLGFVRESGYFDNNRLNDYNQIIGATAGYAFPFLKNLHFGAHFFRLKNLNDFPSRFWQVFDIGFGAATSEKHDKADSILSFTIDWKFPNVGLKLYGEYARNDYSPGFATYLSRPDHSNGYTIGLQKVFPIEDRRFLNMTVEITDLLQTPYTFRANQPIWYKHNDVLQGYTNDGQLLGSPIGPGSDSQILRFDYFNSHVIWSFWGQRIFVDKDYFFSLTIRENDNYSQDHNYAQFIFGVAREELTSVVDWKISLSYQLHLNYGWKPKELRHNLTAFVKLEYRSLLH